MNQYVSSGGVTLGYDARGNLASLTPSSGGATTYTYAKLNELTSIPGIAPTVGYDPLTRVVEYDTSVSTRFYYSGGTPVAEVANPSGTVNQRYVPEPGTDEVVAWYSGAGNTTTPQFLQVDERGSVVAVTNSAGALVAANSYDEFGIPAATNLGRFGYTGQAWFPEVGLYNYKARWYSPSLGRFMQTDPIGYADGLNWYNYAHSDPVDGGDPTGTRCGWAESATTVGDSAGMQINYGPCDGGGDYTPPGGGGGGGRGGSIAPGNPAIVVTGRKSKGVPQSIWSRIKSFAHTVYCALAPHPGTTLQASATGSLAGFGGGYAGGYTAAIDKTGSIELFQTDGGYRSLGGGAGLALTGGASTAKNVGDLAGPFLQGSVTAAEAGGGTATVFAGQSPDGAVVGGEAGLDLGFQDSVMVGVSNSTPVAGVSCP